MKAFVSSIHDKENFLLKCCLVLGQRAFSYISPPVPASHFTSLVWSLRREEKRIQKWIHHCHCPLYATPSKLFFTLCRGKLGQIFEAISRCSRTPGMACHNGKRGNSYPQLRNFGHIACHKVVLLTFVGPRPVYDDGKAAEGDHKNGNIMDFSLDNLEWVHPSENEWRSTHVLQVLRSKSINPTDYTGTQMDHWFAVFRELEKLIPWHWQTFGREDYLRWYAMPIEEFKAMLAHYERVEPEE